MGVGIMGVGLGVGLLVIGAAYGIGKLASSAVESIARQPEAAGNIRGTAIILAALIEGFTFFALIVAIMLGGNAVEMSGEKGYVGPAPKETTLTAPKAEKAPAGHQ
ncbi:MAG: ATP synthase F0 subunit C [Planctomycetota bacterium]